MDEKGKKRIKRVLACTAAGAFALLGVLSIPNSLVASADDYQSEDYDEYVDVFAWDYAKFYTEGQPQYSYYFGNNDFFRIANFANPTIPYDGLYLNGSAWARVNVAYSEGKLDSYSYTLPHGEFDFNGQISVRYSSMYARKAMGLSSPSDFAVLELYYDSVVVPRSMMVSYCSTQSSYGIQVSFVENNGTGVISEGVGAYSYTIRADLFNEYGFLGQLDSTLYRSNNFTYGLFNPVVFDSYEGDVFFLRNCTIQYRCNGQSLSADRAVGIKYQSYLIYPERSLTLNVNTYLEDSGIIKVRYGSGPDEVDYTAWLGNAVGSFMNLEIFPGFSFGGIIGILIAISVAVFVLKFVAGG